MSRRFGSRAVLALCAACLGIGLMAAPASAAVIAFPSGGSNFDGDAQGWTPGDASCTPIALLCTAEAVHDASVGNPPGSISARTTVTLNLVSLFTGTAVWNSPQFTVPNASIAGATLTLDRALSSENLLAVQPTGSYTVTLQDLTAGTSTEVLQEDLATADGTFATSTAPVSVLGGHTYQLSIETTETQTLLALGVLNGTVDLNFDNVALLVTTAGGDDNSGGGLPNPNDNGNARLNGKGGKGGNGGNGGRGVSSSKLLVLLKRSSTSAPTVLKGRRLFVKVNCPRKIGRACRIAARGMLNRHKAVTATRVVKVGKGKGRRIVLRVKPRFRQKVAKRKRLLVREKVRAGKAHATFFKRRKLIRR